jgi:signal transduction histidine kinase
MIEIAADRTEYEFWISVKDHGPGFSEHDKNFLFQKFKKLSARPTGGETSNGLGLAIVKILVDRLKGKIELISQQGKGSHFIVRFPQQKQYA